MRTILQTRVMFSFATRIMLLTQLLDISNEINVEYFALCFLCYVFMVSACISQILSCMRSQYKHLTLESILENMPLSEFTS